MNAAYGGVVPQQDTDAFPPALREKHCIFWTALTFLLATVCILDTLSGLVYNAIFSAALTGAVWYMTTKQCANMNQYLLVVVLLASSIQGIFGVVAFVGDVGGRKIKHTTSIPIGDDKVTYSTTTETHPYFDETQGFRYNVQSAVGFLAPIAMAFASFLSWWTYNAFPRYLFSTDPNEESNPLNTQSLAGRVTNAVANMEGLMVPTSTGPARVFEGKSFKLGHCKLDSFDAAKVP